MRVFNIDTELDEKKLILFAETQAVTDNIVREYLATLLIEDENVLSSICSETEHIGASLKNAALRDLTWLWDSFAKTNFNEYIPSIKRTPFFEEYRESLESVTASASPDEMLDRLILHYSSFGCGDDAKYIAFKWHNGLIGINNPDNANLENLFCLDMQKEELVENTIAFLRGAPAENVLLYGSRGSGKSSMVKALLNEYYKDGLRMVEISRDEVSELPKLIDCVSKKKFKYIIFMDDLSFEENEYGYKSLKVVLEGRLERCPENVLFYATSNRRHMLNESWLDRQGDDMRVNDTLNEKLSLAERFGLSLYFQQPDQTEYFAIIEGLLSSKGIPLSEDIKSEAIKWAQRRGGRSGRVAERFAEKLQGKKV